jgi:protein-tyrosine kinase
LDWSADVTQETRAVERVQASVIHSSSVSARTDVEVSANLVAISAPLSSSAESIRILRTHILAQHVNAGRRALAICAASVDVGCTFVACNLGVSLAQSGLKVLLVDADLRAPHVHEFIRPVRESTGLAACLQAPGSAIGEFIDDEVLPNLSIFYAGAEAIGAQEMLAREWFDDVMKYCMREYDVTIVDTPPANTSSDARRISNVVGYSLIVARRNRSLVQDIKILTEQLIDDRVSVIGTLLKVD